MELQERVHLLSGAAEQELSAKKLQAAREQDLDGELIRARQRIKVDLANVSGTPAGMLPTIHSLSNHERKHYSLAKLLRDSLTGVEGPTLERDVSDGISADLKQVPKGRWVPLRIRASGLDLKTQTAGAYLAGREVGDVIDYLAAQSKVLTLGAQMITGLSFAPVFPTENSPTVASWVSENPGSDVAEVNQTFGARTVSAHSLQATNLVSRQLLLQSSADMENWLRRKLAEAHALALDKAAIHGSGSAGQPLGLLSVPSIGDLALGQNGAAATGANIVELERLGGDGDAQFSGFLTNSLQRSKLRSVPEITSGTTPVWKDGTLLGHRAEVSDQVASNLVKGSSSDCSPIIYSADWSKLLFFEFTGAIDIVVDPFNVKKRGMVELTSFGTYDVLVQQPARFSAIKDAR